MKHNIIKLIGCTIIALFILASCESDDGFEFKPYTRGQDYSWGYMDGIVENLRTGERYPVSHKQHPSLESRQGRRDELRYRSELNRHVLFRRISFFFNDKEAHNYAVSERTEEMLPSLSFINLTLVDDFRTGMIEIVDSDEYVDSDGGDFTYSYNSSVSIVVYDDVAKVNQFEVKPLRYVPDKNNPFIVLLDIVEFNKDFIGSPLIEGRLRGILYCEDNPDDRMMVDMRFGM